MIVLENSDLECNIEDIFSSPAEEKACLKRLSSYLHGYRSNLRNFLAKGLTNCKGTSNKLVENKEHIAQSINEAKNLQAEFDSELLSQKIAQRQMTNTQAMETALREEVQKERDHRDAITLEMVDLQEELARQKEAKKKEWNAIKLANAAYKEHLNIHLNVKHEDDVDIITLTYFHLTNPNADSYYVVLEHSNNSWRVSNIQPPLKEKYLTEMKLDFSKDYETVDITRFLCQIRSNFLNHYNGCK